MLEINNVKKYFGGISAVDGCSFGVEKNNITALIGPNGSGKTTLFNLISGIIRPDQGNIIFDDVDITRKSIEHIVGGNISRLFQQPRLFRNLTVRQNLEIAINNRNTFFWHSFKKRHYNHNYEKKISEIMESLGIFGIQDKKAGDISYGQKRLTEMARALVAPHKLLMLDEPVSGVNPLIRDRLRKLLPQLKESGETILFIEHDMRFTLSTADHVIVLDEGRVIARGAPDYIKNNHRVLEAYLGDNYA